MSKSTVSGVCLYEKEGCYYIESYKEKKNGGTVTFETVKREKLGKPHGVEISAAKQDGTGEKTLRDNAEIPLVLLSGSGMTDLPVPFQSSVSIQRIHQI